jgi:hypothetical protein
MHAVFEKPRQPFLGERNRIGSGDTDCRKAERLRLLDQRGFQVGGRVQKSRSA